MIDWKGWKEVVCGLESKMYEKWIEEVELMVMMLKERKKQRSQ